MPVVMKKVRSLLFQQLHEHAASPSYLLLNQYLIAQQMFLPDVEQVRHPSHRHQDCYRH